jgi:hypothetical protein
MWSSEDPSLVNNVDEIGLVCLGLRMKYGEARYCIEYGDLSVSNSSSYEIEK